MSRFFGPKPQATPEPPPAAPEPQPSMTKEAVQEMLSGALNGAMQQLAPVLTNLQQGIEQLAQRPTQVVQAPQPAFLPQRPAITDDDIDNAVLSGQGAASRIRALVDRAVNDAQERMLRDHVQPLQQFGVQTLSELTKRITSGGMKHYGKYKKEIEERLNQLAPELRANPSALEMVYSTVIGEHNEEIVNEAVEEAIRKQQAGGEGAAPGTGTPVDKNKTTPAFEEYLGTGGNEARAALQHKGQGGQGEDDFARGLGYKNFADYMAQYENLLKETGDRT